jgi:hypothetical protein
VTCGGGVNLIIQFWLERRDDVPKHFRKMKRRQRTHLDSLGRKRDTTRRSDDVGRRRGDTGEGKGMR